MKTITSRILVLVSILLLVCGHAYSDRGEAMWQDDGPGIIPERGTSINYCEIIPDGHGGTILGWNINELMADNYDVYAEKIDVNGNSLWGDNGVLICDAENAQYLVEMISDGCGGAILIWEDLRNSDEPFDGMYDIFAQRVDSNGNIQWEENGIAVCEILNPQKDLVAVLDNNGNTIIVWEDYRILNDGDLYAQKIDPAGNLIWLNTGVPICNAVTDQEFIDITTDGNGGAIITWEDTRTRSYDVYAQRIDSDGNVLWHDDGIVVSNANRGQRYPEIASDGCGGAIITWLDKRWMAHWDIYAQRIDADGNAIWEDNGISVCFVINDQVAIEVISDCNNGAIIVWEDERLGNNNPDIYAERIDKDGNRLWSDNNGLSVCSADGKQIYPYLVSDSRGGAFFSWHDDRGVANGFDIYAQKINASGEAEWENNGIVICNADLDQFHSQIISDNRGGAVVMWQDQRLGGFAYSMYTQRIEGIHTWYLAEGATLNGFDEWICIQNPNNRKAEVEVTFMKSDGENIVRDIEVEATSRYTIYVNDIVPNAEVSTKLVSTNGVGVIVERAMYRSSGGIDWAAAHCSSAITHTDTVWYLAEGATLNGFDQWICIQNPNNRKAEVEVTFMKSDGTTVVRNIEVEAVSRYTIHANEIVPNESISTKLESTNKVGIIVERAMYRSSGGVNWIAAHCSAGINSPNTVWYLAEGATLNNFSEWICIQNPSNNDAEVEVTFMKSDGSTVVRNIDVEATSRYTIHVNGVVPNSSVSAKIESTNGVGLIVERAMYRTSGGIDWASAHCSFGITTPTTKWHLAEGATLNNFDEWICLQNPNDEKAEVEVTFMKSDGTTVVREIEIDETSRYTIHANLVVPNESVSVTIESTNGVGIIVERAMYRTSGGIDWAAAHCSGGIVY